MIIDRLAAAIKFLKRKSLTLVQWHAYQSILTAIAPPADEDATSGLKEARSELEADFCVGRHGQRVAFKRGPFHLHLGVLLLLVLHSITYWCIVPWGKERYYAAHFNVAVVDRQKGYLYIEGVSRKSKVGWEKGNEQPEALKRRSASANK
jgi:hypothetical protein